MVMSAILSFSSRAGYQHRTSYLEEKNGNGKKDEAAVQAAVQEESSPIVMQNSHLRAIG